MTPLNQLGTSGIMQLSPGSVCTPQQAINQLAFQFFRKPQDGIRSQDCSTYELNISSPILLLNVFKSDWDCSSHISLMFLDGKYQNSDEANYSFNVLHVYIFPRARSKA